MTTVRHPKILVIRRDNIGDLVCTTPLLAALRQRFPGAWLGALVNSYNAPVLDGNPDLDAVFVYTKAKHREGGQSLAGILWRRLLMLKALRAMHLDDVLIATTSPQPRSVKLARWLKPGRIVGYGDTPGLHTALPLASGAVHEVEDVFRLAKLYGIEGEPPPCRVVPPAATRPPPGLTVAIHISARKPSQRWPAEHFAELMRGLQQSHGAHFVLLWAPGAEDNRLHPGDDGKAARLLELLGQGFPVTATPTTTLAQLITALAGCNAMICADGGAMHLAAGLGLPIVCLFGQSGAERWRPWGVAHEVLQKESREVADIAPAEVLAAFGRLPVG